MPITGFILSIANFFADTKGIKKKTKIQIIKKCQNVKQSGFSFDKKAT